MQYFAVVDTPSKNVLSRLQLEDGRTPYPEPHLTYVAITVAEFNSLEVTRHPQGGAHCWRMAEGDVLTPVPDGRNVLTVTMSSVIIAENEQVTIEYDLTLPDGTPIPGSVEGITSVLRERAPTKNIRATITDGYRSFTYAFPDSGNYTLKVDGLLMKGDYKFTVVEDIA